MVHKTQRIANPPRPFAAATTAVKAVRKGARTLASQASSDCLAEICIGRSFQCAFKWWAIKGGRGKV